jgi:phenylacetate-CoA ligase
MEEHDLMGIAGGYGAADLGMSVGREYPISVLIRKLANKKKALARDLFGEESIPSLCQYNPATFYIEEVNKELVFSCQPGMPLIRYNIHDHGGVIPFERTLDIVRSHGFDPLKLLAEYGYTKRDIWRLPFFFVYGRSDGTISVDGANVYPENVEAAFFRAPEGKTVQSFKLKKTTDDQFNEHIKILIELTPEGSKSADRLGLQQRLHKIVLDHLLATNGDYKESYLHNPKSADFEIMMYGSGEGQFANDRTAIKIHRVVI